MNDKQLDHDIKAMKIALKCLISNQWDEEKRICYETYNRNSAINIIQVINERYTKILDDLE